MSKTRKVLALALALVMSCTMAACGGDSEMTDGGSTSTSADGTYKIGMIYPMSGGNALFGNAMVSATEIAVDMINEAGGVNGTQIQLVVGDGATSSEASTEATRMIDSEGVNVIIGSMSSGNANAIRSVTERSNVILWETSAVADNVLDGNSGLTFRICDQGSYRGYNAVKFLCEELADDLGIRVIQLAGYDVYYEEGSEQTRKDFADNLKKAVEMAAVHGVVLGFETMETEFMNTVAKSMKYVDLIDNPYLGVYPDVGNLTNAAKTYGTSVLDDLETGRGHLVAMHLKETVPGKFREIPFLTGHVDFPAVIRKGWQLGVRRFVTEMWDTGKPEWKEDICFAHDKMSEILDTME